MKTVSFLAMLISACVVSFSAIAAENVIHVSSLQDLARHAATTGNRIRMEPGVYRMSDYLTDAVLQRIRQGVDRSQRRPTVPMLVLSGSNNHFDLRGVVLEIQTELYPKLPGGGYVRCVFVSGNSNTFDGLTIRSTGPNQGSNGNILALFGTGNTLENVTLFVHGSFPYGYGDLLGKGGPNLVPLQKQSGIQVMGGNTTLRRCKVFSRALGHCFYIQGGNDNRLQDCYAEGVMRSTSDMLRDTNGPAFDLGFKSVYENRDGRFLITPGYMKSLVEDGFRTYGSAGNVSLINCVAINTRAGFEIAAPDQGERKSTIEDCVALGCERGYLLGSHVVVRRSRGDIAHGPLLYLRGGRDADVELEVTGEGSNYTVHALATIAGSNHRVRLTGRSYDLNFPQLPIMLGFGMPDHGEMASPIRPAPARSVTLINEISGATVITSTDAIDSTIETKGRILTDADSKKAP